VIYRRAFLAGAAALLAAPLVAEAQQASRVYRIGWLSDGEEAPSPMSAAFADTLRELGYVEGKNLLIDRRYANFNYGRLPELAADLVRLNPDVIVAGGNLNIAALKHATSTVPVVMTYAIDPVGAGLITSLARPDGNITGMSATTGPEFIAKQLELLKETVPKLSRVGILVQHGRTGPETAAIESAARKLALTVLYKDVRIPNDIDGAFVAMTRSRVGALLILGGSVTWANRQQIADLAVKHRLPGIHFFREYAEAGLLLSYGINFVAQFRRAAVYVDKILKGAKPGDLPIEQPTKFELVINLRTAKALRLTVPQSLLQQADQVIE
jgi:putative ABC transport system substrate-binding protein